MEEVKSSKSGSIKKKGKLRKGDKNSSSNSNLSESKGPISSVVYPSKKKKTPANLENKDSNSGSGNSVVAKKENSNQNSAKSLAH